MKYHKDIGFPKSLILPNGKFRLTYTNHANYKSESIFGLASVMHELFSHVYVDKNAIIEVTTDDNVNCKSFLIRYRVTTFDIILAIKPFNAHSGLIITVWDNDKSDHHATLDESKYDLPDNNNSKEIDEIYAGK